jgi:pyridoxine 5'-phosphate synthase PdxJ
MGTLKLDVSVDHIATLRQARYATAPDWPKSAAMAWVAHASRVLVAVFHRDELSLCSAR